MEYPSGLKKPGMMEMCCQGGKLTGVYTGPGSEKYCKYVQRKKESEIMAPREGTPSSLWVNCPQSCLPQSSWCACLFACGPSSRLSGREEPTNSQ
jgi:hypothetical protein